MTFARIKEFVDPDVQTEGQRWMAMELVKPLLTAVADYDAWLIDTGNKFKFFHPDIPGKTTVG
eukprot:13294274-Heterocapsa_arctica.AAC.1